MGQQPSSWTLAGVAADRLILAYTGANAPVIPPGQYLSNLTPANTNEIFYRKVIPTSDDAANKRFTLFTVSATLAELVKQGSLSVSSDSLVLKVDASGAIIKTASIAGTIAFPRIGFSLDGTEFTLKDAKDFDIIKLSVEELHWWLTPKLSASLDLSLTGLRRFEAVASGHSEFAMVFNLDVLLRGARAEYLLYELPEPLQPHTWMYLGNIGPVPVFAELSFDVQVKATPEAKALLHFAYGLRQESDLAFGLHYENSKVDIVESFLPAPVEVVPFTADVNGELSLTLSVEPQMQFLVYGLAGVSAGITPSGKIAFVASTGDPPLTGTLEASVSLDLGVAGPALESLSPKPGLSIPLWQDEWPLFPPPGSIVIQAQPQNVVVNEGGSAYFTISATAAKPLSYQWFQNGVPLPGETARTLLLPYVTVSYAGGYYVSLKAGSQMTNSAIATLKVSSNLPAPSGMALIPAGSFTMGDALDGYELPTHTVQVSAFYMDKTLVTKALWDQVCQWGISHGYSFDNPGSGKASNHPVQTVNWYDVVKWCNARSEQEGRVPAYYTSSVQATVYRSGRVDVQESWVKWNAGYRLPTEAEWEKAARGGLSGKRFPWGDTITHNQANYDSSSLYSYDVSATRGYHPNYQSGGTPYTSPVSSFAANGYGLYDMAGNLWEWCWDWYGSYSSGSQTDPRGPGSGSNRVARGGSWRYDAYYCRVTYRDDSWPGFMQLMQLKLFIVPVKNVAAAEAEMNAFLRGHRVLAVKKEFVPDGENSFWTFCVEFLDSPGPMLNDKRPKVDYKEVLKPGEFEVFSRLREWRKAVAEKEGVPVYTILTNEQLAQMVQKCVNNKTALKEIEGIGEARVEKYGEALMKLLRPEAMKSP